MATEFVKNKKDFNARTRELAADGYKKTREFGSYQCFSKHVYGADDLSVKLVQGWKKNI